MGWIIQRTWCIHGTVGCICHAHNVTCHRGRTRECGIDIIPKCQWSMIFVWIMRQRGGGRRSMPCPLSPSSRKSGANQNRWRYHHQRNNILVVVVVVGFDHLPQQRQRQWDEAYGILKLVWTAAMASIDDNASGEWSLPLDSAVPLLPYYFPLSIVHPAALVMVPLRHKAMHVQCSMFNVLIT